LSIADESCLAYVTEPSYHEKKGVKLRYTMEEDFGSSIWATQESGTTSLSSPYFSTLPRIPPTINQFDEFGGYGTQGDAAPQGDDDDEFGDFGEFGQAEDTTKEFADSSRFSVPIPMTDSSPWDRELRRFDPQQSRPMLEAQIEDILGPLWDGDDLNEALTDEDVREVGGLAQILVTPDR
jgi:hypothetical protein